MKFIKTILLIMCIVFLPAFSYAANTLYFQSTALRNMGDIELGKGGWDYPNSTARVSVTVNIDTAPCTFKITAPDFNGGTFPKENIRINVVYIGHELGGAPWWENDDDSLLTSDFPYKTYVEYSGADMSVAEISAADLASWGGGSKDLKIEFDITVQVPEDGKNIYGDYSNTITFEITP